MLSCAKSHPAVGIEVVVIDHPVAVKTEQIILGCTNLDELRHVRLPFPGVSSKQRMAERLTWHFELSPSGADTMVAADPDRRGHDA
jgi:hypothetical protein